MDQTLIPCGKGKKGKSMTDYASARVKKDVKITGLSY